METLCVCVDEMITISYYAGVGILESLIAPKPKERLREQLQPS